MPPTDADRWKPDAGQDRDIAIESARLWPGELLAKAIGELGIDEARCARRIGISARTLRDVMSGAVRIDLDQLAEWLHVLGYRLKMDIARDVPVPRVVTTESTTG